MIVLIKKILSFFHLTPLLRRVYYFVCQIICRLRYIGVLRRIRRKAASGVPIRVLFVVDNISKWKAQKLYDEMKHSPVFEPIVGLTLGAGISFNSLSDRLSIELSFYKSRYCDVVALYDVNSGVDIPVSSLKPDIVFYQECCAGAKRGQCVFDVSKYAVTMYIPYSLEYGTVAAIYRKPNFQDLLFLNVCWNKEREKYLKGLSLPFSRAGKIVSLGYPFIDELLDGLSKNGDYVIYAPHFSFPVKGVSRPLTIGTFMDTGLLILEYAQKHPEIKWVFKPHPGLRDELEKTGGWTRKEVDAYYLAWEKLGIACYTGDYPCYFARSKAMITDSASFLLEFAVTKKPIVWIVNKDHKHVATKLVEPLFNTYYRVVVNEGLYEILDKIIIDNQDPLRQVRISELCKLNLVPGGTDRIMTYLKNTVLGV